MVGYDTFRSFNNIYTTLDELAKNQPDQFSEAMKKYPQINSEDEILNDDYFSRLVNENKEIILNNSLYKISKEGVLVLGSQDIENYIKSTKESGEISTAEFFTRNQKYKTFSSAKFFSTESLNPNREAIKAKLTKTSGLPLPDLDLPGDNEEGGGSDYYTYLADGCRISYHDYSNTREYEYFPGNAEARIKVKFWANNWLIYKTIGIKVVVQKQTSSVFDWWGSYENHDFAKANIVHLAYRIKKKDFFPPAGVFTNVPSFGTIASSLLKSAVKIQISSDLDILAFDLRDLAQKGTLSNLFDRIPANYGTGENILAEIIKNKAGTISDKLFTALDKELGPEFQGKKIQKAFYYTPAGTTEPILVVQNREYATYGSGIIDETLVKE